MSHALIFRLLISRLLMFSLPFMVAVNGQAQQVSRIELPLVFKAVIDDQEAESSMIRTIIKKSLGKEIEVARYQEVFTRQAAKVSVRSVIPMSKTFSTFGGPDQITRSSSGILRDGQYMPTDVMEQRGSKKPAYVAKVDYEQRKVRFYKNDILEKEAALEGNPVDLFYLPYLWVGGVVPTKTLRLDLLDAKKVYRHEEFVASEVIVDLLGEKIPSVKLTRTRTSPETENFEVWIRKSDGVPIRMKISLNTKYGVNLDSYLYMPPVITRVTAPQ